jgi:cyclase
VATYARGLEKVSERCWAWLEPDGGWGFSNAGVILGSGEALLVDTLFDLAMARRMLEGCAALTGGCPIRTVVNTHANGDHWYGNELVGDAAIVASAATAAEMATSGPDLLQALKGLPGLPGRFASQIFGAFDFTGITPTLPTRTFEDRLELDVGGTGVVLLELGPAHTEGDTIAFVPDERTVFTGDLLFIGGTPITWAGPVSNWVRACDVMLDLDADVFVPGHGPVTDKRGVEEVKDYLMFVDRVARERCAAGMGPEDAIRSIDLGRFAELGERGRLAQNVLAVYRELRPDLRLPSVLDMFAMMARLEGWEDEPGGGVG